MERLSKLYNENRLAITMGSAVVLTTASAVYFYRRRMIPAVPGPVSVVKPTGPAIKWLDPHFKSENLDLYSEEASVRSEQLKDVSYRLIVNLSDSEEKGYGGAFRTSFSLTQ